MTKKSQKDKISEEQQKKIEELTDTVKRVQAEFVNYKNRVEKESKSMGEYSNAELVKNMLPVLDSFELAVKNASDLEKFKDGMEMVYAQFIGILKQQGLSPIETKGKKFDPYFHEVLLKVKSKEPEDTILEELQKGYMFKDRVIRHSKVKVSSG